MAWTGNTTNNQPPNPVQHGENVSDVKRDYNRAYATRRDTDTFSDGNISLQDIDTVIINHLKNNINLQVTDNNELVSVPVIYGDPERWVAMRAGAGLRDNQGKLQLPAFMLSRVSVENNRNLETFNRYLTYEILSGYTEKNKYDRFDLLTGNKPTKQILSVTLPKHVVCNYECVIWTDYVAQNNRILEQINFAEKDYWGDKYRYKFRARIDNYDISTDTDNTDDRNVKATFNLQVYAYLLNPTIVPAMEGIKSTTQKLFTVRKIVTSEHVVSAQQMQDINNTEQNDPNKSEFASSYEYRDGYVVERDKTAIKTNIPTSDGNVVVYKTSFHPAPTTLQEYGENGWMAYDKNYIYVYQYPKGWMKASISEFDYDPTKQIYISEYDCDNNPVYVTGSMRPINTAFRTFQRYPDKFYQQVPLQSSDYGEDGWVSYDGSYFYIYSFGKWRRVPISAVFSS